MIRRVMAGRSILPERTPGEVQHSSVERGIMCPRGLAFRSIWKCLGGSIMKQISRCVGILCGLLIVVQASAAELPVTKAIVIARESTLPIEGALVEGDELWVPAENVAAVTGFAMKPEGLCAADLCVPIPADAGWVREQGGKTYFNLVRFARKMGQEFAVDADENVWSFTAVPTAQTSPLLAGEAPDFALPDRNGKTVRLSDYRGKKVLVLTWASWCGCRFDLVGWQKIREELKDKNFEIIAAAEDTGGAKVADPWYEKAQATFPALVDANHTVSSLYQMVNVPTGVWIDETGKIVRAPEVAYTKQQKVLGQTIGDDRYVDGLRDWVDRGPQSAFVVPPEKLQSRLALRTANERLADAQFKLGAYFSEHGKRDLASKHWQMAQQLNPDSWNYHRQDWSFDKAQEMTNFLAKVRKLGTRPYYDPVEFPAAPPAKTPPPASP